MNGFQCARNHEAVCVIESIRCIVLIAVEEPGINLIFVGFCILQRFAHVRNGQLFQCDAAPERITVDCFNFIRNGSDSYIGAVVEDALAECLDSTRHMDFLKTGAAAESIVADGFECSRERNAVPCQTGTTGKAGIADAFGFWWDAECFYAGAVLKGRNADLGNAVRQGDCLQGRHVFEAVVRNDGALCYSNVFQCAGNDITVSVVETCRCIILIAVEEPGVNLIFAGFSVLKCRTHERDCQGLQRCAAPERIALDGLDAVTDDGFGHAGAAVECAFLDCFDSTRNVDQTGACALRECVCADGLDRCRDGALADLQRLATCKAVCRDLGDAVRQNELLTVIVLIVAEDFEAAAAVEGVFAECLDRIGQVDLLQVGGSVKDMAADGGENQSVLRILIVHFDSFNQLRILER